MKPSPFEYLRPDTLEAALRALSDHKDRDAKVLAGGQSLVPMMNFRVAAPEVLIDLNGIGELSGISEEDGVLRIGAMTRAAAVKSNAQVALRMPLIPMAYEHVAHATVRNRGTLGGNLCHCDPASEMPMVMLVCEAEMEIAGPGGTRTEAAEDFFLGTYTTSLEPDEILTAIRIPFARPGARFAFEEVSLRRGDFAMVAVGVRLEAEGGICKSLAIGLCGIATVALRAEAAEAEAAGHELARLNPAQLAETAVAGIPFEDTATQTAAFRRDTTRALVQRALETCLTSEAT
ncbi:MAG: xanthine dehydrogenase family protein subunit M [Nitratireductor sp.]|nr:xanthine dehydrogenase family protein subunit M [Nitratireductor sp.]